MPPSVAPEGSGAPGGPTPGVDDQVRKPPKGPLHEKSTALAMNSGPPASPAFPAGVEQPAASAPRANDVRVMPTGLLRVENIARPRFLVRLRFQKRENVCDSHGLAHLLASHHL